MSSAVAVAFQQNLYSISRSITSRGFSATALFYLASNPARAIDRDTTRAYSYQMFCALRSSNNLSVLKWILDEWSSTVMTPLEWSFLTIWHVPSEAWNGIPYLISHKYACSIEEFQRSHVAFKYTVLFRIIFFLLTFHFYFFPYIAFGSGMYSFTLGRERKLALWSLTVDNIQRTQLSKITTVVPVYR